MEIGKQIRRRRTELNLSRGELANKIHVTPSAIANYENGVSYPKPDILVALMNALDVDANYLYWNYLSNSTIQRLYRKVLSPEEKESILKNVLKPVMDFYDYIVIDTPPALNLLTVNAYAVSDYLIIPMASDILSLVGLSQLKETVESVRIQINPGLKIMGILLNRFNPRTCLCRDVLEMAGQLAAQLETRVFDTKIRSGVAIAEAPAHGESIFEYSPRASAVKDYGKFLDEVEKIIGFREK